MPTPNTDDATRNPHAGRVITDDDATNAALEDLSVPTLLLTLGHMTGARRTSAAI